MKTHLSLVAACALMAPLASPCFAAPPAPPALPDAAPAKHVKAAPAPQASHPAARPPQAPRPPVAMPPPQQPVVRHQQPTAPPPQRHQAAQVYQPPVQPKHVQAPAPVQAPRPQPIVQQPPPVQQHHQKPVAQSAPIAPQPSPLPPQRKAQHPVAAQNPANPAPFNPAVPNKVNKHAAQQAIAPVQPAAPGQPPAPVPTGNRKHQPAVAGAQPIPPVQPGAPGEFPAPVQNPANRKHQQAAMASPTAPGVQPNVVGQPMNQAAAGVPQPQQQAKAGAHPNWGAVNTAAAPNAKTPQAAWKAARPDGKPGKPAHGDTFINAAQFQNGKHVQSYLANRGQGGTEQWAQNRNAYWNKWSAKNEPRVERFEASRAQRWNNLNAYPQQHWNNFAARTPDWVNWQHSYVDYRRDRADQIRNYARDSYAYNFTPDWWQSNPRWSNNFVVADNISPWWWWRAAQWGSFAFLYPGGEPQPIAYDYGTDVIVDDDNLYLSGNVVGSAADYRQQAIALANPATTPPPPVPQSDDDNSLTPLGVWSLVPQEGGDATMFYQLSMTRDGLITGAYTNSLTNETQPVTGSVDRETQRVAWKTGENSTSAIECTLNGLTQEQTPAFIHYANGTTQTWLLVRMQDPEFSAKGPVGSTEPSPSPIASR